MDLCSFLRLMPFLFAIHVFFYYWDCPTFVGIKIKLLLVVLWVLHALPRTASSIPNEQQMIDGYFFTTASNVRRIMRQNFESDDEAEVRVERHAVRNFTTRDTIVVVHHNLMDLVHPISKTSVSNNSRATAVRNFP